MGLESALGDENAMGFKQWPWGFVAVLVGMGCSHPPRQAKSKPNKIVTSNTSNRQCTANRVQMAHNDMPHNALQPEALMCTNALLGRISSSSLRTETFSELNADERAGFDKTKCPYTQELLSYVISCALGPCDVVQTPQGELHGEVGLCPQWATGAPSEECRQVVSACVIARTNAWDKKVIISLRGHPALGLLDKVPVETEIRNRGGQPIRSFEPCQHKTTGAPERNCGWQPRYVGRCESPGDVVISAPQAPLMVRICGGIHGCDHEGGVVYSRWVSDKLLANPKDSLTFACPENGPATDDGKAFGYYSVLVAAPHVRRDDLTPDIDVVTSSGNYPASEEQVFTMREGAFYGNIFPSPSSGGPYACHNAGWGDDWRAFITGRGCTIPKVGCFTNEPRACDSVCSQQAADGTYQNCRGPSAAEKTWMHPLTTFLNHPDDLTPEDAPRLHKQWKVKKGLPPANASAPKSDAPAASPQRPR